MRRRGQLLADEGSPRQALLDGSSAGSAIVLGDWLIGALADMSLPGGEVSPVRSAGMVIARSEPWPVTDLRVDWHEDPAGELAGLWARWQPQAESYVRRALRPSENG